MLGKEYDNFKDVWDTVPTNAQTLNLLIEKLCAIELQADKQISAEATALVAHENDKKKSNSMKVKSSKSMESKADRAKQKFPCNKCRQLGHWAAECPQKQKHAGSRIGKLAVKKNTDTFLAYVMGASRANSVDADTWYCDSGATQHITPNKHYFVSYTKFANPETLVLGKKNVQMQAYGQGMINVQMFCNGMWNDAILKNVWYAPDARAHQFSVKAAAQNGYSTTLNEKGVVIRRSDGTVAASGNLRNDMYALALRVCIPQHTAGVHLATQMETLQVWHERLGHQNKRHVRKVLKQHGINVKADKEICDGCALGKAHRQSFGTRTTRPNIVGEQINTDVCGPMTEKSAAGARYYACFKDDYSKFRRVFFITAKCEVKDCLRNF
jgi:hypothetical protein